MYLLIFAVWLNSEIFANWYIKTSFHLVIPGSSDKFTCDCANYNLLNLCSHTVAVAEIIRRVDKFVAWHRKLKVTKCYQAFMKDVAKKGRKLLPKRRKWNLLERE